MQAVCKEERSFFVRTLDADVRIRWIELLVVGDILIPRPVACGSNRKGRSSGCAAASHCQLATSRRSAAGATQRTLHDKRVDLYAVGMQVLIGGWCDGRVRAAARSTSVATTCLHSLPPYSAAIGNGSGSGPRCDMAKTRPVLLPNHDARPAAQQPEFE